MTAVRATTADTGARPRSSGSKLQRRMMVTLTLSQVFGTVGATAGYTVAAVVSVSLVGSTTLAGVAQAVSSVGTVAAAALLARISGGMGRRASLATGYAIALGGAIICIISIDGRSFVGFTLGGILVSVASVTNFQARYGAADLAKPGSATRSISVIVWVSTIGSVAGPNISSFSTALSHRLGIPVWSGVYLLGGLGFAIAAIILMIGLRPDPLLTARANALAAKPPVEVDTPTDVPVDAPVPVAPVRTAKSQIFRDGGRAIVRSRPATFALASIAVGHTVMIAIMTWTPVHMSHAHDGLAPVGAVLSGHFVGMFAFAPVVGWLADRFGNARMMFASALVMSLGLAATGSSVPGNVLRLTVGLFLIGLAWCGMFVIGSSLLTESIDDESRVAAQGFTDTFMWVCSAITVGLAGWVMGIGGYVWLSGVCAVLTLVVTILGIGQLAKRAPGSASLNGAGE